LKIPERDDRNAVHRVIFEELCCGIVRDASRAHLAEIIARGVSEGADSVILGCTELGLLIAPKDTGVPLFDSTLIHADAAVAFAIGPRVDVPNLINIIGG
jgi:aspartate racemase